MDLAEDIDVDLAVVDTPERVGRYRIGPQLARGGMAQVCLASEEGGSEVLAIKLVHPHLVDDSDFVEMFLDEARITTRIEHPNVCRVFDYGEANDTLYLAMELLRGIPLSKLARRVRKAPEVLRDPRWPRVAARILSEVCAGLHAAHELVDETGTALNVVHRDVSPHNVFVCWNGVSKILDFGVAAAEHRLHMTAAGTVKGKFEYIAPEQIQSKKVDRRADVWAVGTLLWELLAGRSLFRGESHAVTITQVLGAKVPPLDDAPPELFAIATRALKVDPNERYQTTKEIHEALDAWLGEFHAPDVAAMLVWLLPGAEQAEAARIEEHAQGKRPAVTVEPVSDPSISRVRRSAPPWLPIVVGGVLILLLSGLVWAIAYELRGDDPPSSIEKR